MYLEFFGLTERPFTITPNPRFLFLSRQHKEAFAHLFYGIRNRSGFIEVTGEVGAGKTTVLRTLLEQLEGDDYRLAFIFNPSLSAAELLRAICRELEIPTGEAGGGEMLDAIYSFLLRENRAGRTVVLVIDEAQNLAPPVLEQVRLLSNLETAGDKLIQIVLVGQPELGKLLDRPELRQLNQRITVRYHLRPIDLDETRAYIRHRLELAGLRDRELFSPAAVRRIFRFSGGLPRLINVLCDRALLVAFSEDRRRVTLAEVRTAIAELGRKSPRRRWPLLGFGAALALLGGLTLLVPSRVVEQEIAPTRPGLAGVRQPVPAGLDGGGRNDARSTPAAGQAATTVFHGDGTSLTLGLVPVAAGPLSSLAQARRLADYLGNRTGKVLRVEIFPDQATLYQGVYRDRRIDLAWFRGGIPHPASHLPLQTLVVWRAESGRQTGGGLLVARRGLGGGPLQALRSALLGMAGEGQGRRILAAAGGISFSAPPESGQETTKATRHKNDGGKR